MDKWNITWPFAKWISLADSFYYIAICYLAFHMFCFPFVVYPNLTNSGPTWLGLDISWQVAINYAWINKLNWGHDLIFSYGPLGFLATRVGWGVSKWVFFVFDIFIVFNFFYVFKDFVFKSSERILALIILVSVVLITNPYYGSDLSWVFMFFTFFWMYKAHKEQRIWHFFMITLLIGLSFYIKLNTALVIIFFYLGFVVNLVIFKSVSYRKASILVLLTIIWIVLLAFFFNVSIQEYISGSIEIIKGYNDIMYLQENHLVIEDYLIWVLRFTIILYIAFVWILIQKKKYGELYFALISMAFVFLLAKQSLVRNDVQHLYEFFSFAPLVLISGNLLIRGAKLQKYFNYGILIIFLLALLIKTGTRPLEIAIEERFGKRKDYLQLLKEYNPEEYRSHKDKRYIPLNILDKIGHSSIDVFPWDIEYLIQNKLNFTPRPVFQTYTAYTAYLEDKNYEYYLKNGPEYVLYDYDAIDNRYPFNDELKVNLFLAKNYTITDTFSSNERWRLVLKRDKIIRPIVYKPTKQINAKIDQEILTEGNTCITIDLDYSLAGKYKAFSYKTPAVNIMFMKADGKWISFKTSRELLKAGIMVDKLILSNKDFADYITNKNTLEPIVKCKLELDKSYFSPMMKLNFYKIE